MRSVLVLHPVIFASIDAQIPVSQTSGAHVRTPLARLVGLAVASSLVLAPLAVAGPASAIGPGNGIISVKLVDDLGQPVTGTVQLIPSGGGVPLMLGVPAGADPAVPVPAASFLEEIDAGVYGAVAVGGWAGVTCVGLSTCSPTALMSAWSVPLGAGSFAVNQGATTPLTITIATPKLTGAPGIGKPLTVSVPSSLKEVGVAAEGLVGGSILGLSTDPVIAWNRNGSPSGMTGSTYTPTSADAGATISAMVTFPALQTLMLGQLAEAGVAPPPFTTAAVRINRLAPRIKIALPRKIQQGKRATAYVIVTTGSALVRGVVTFAVGKARPQRAGLRSGLATFKLPKLKPGRYKVTAAFAAGGAYSAAKSTKTIVVKGQKARKNRS